MNIDKPNLFVEKIKNNKTLFEILFNRNDYYNKGLYGHYGHSVAIMAS